MKISAVYRIINTVTNKCYVGSSRNIIHRWAEHKSPSRWKQQPNSPLYQDMQKYGVDKFRFQILVPVMEECLKQVEQEFIDMLHPTYNSIRANGWDVERRKEHNKKYYQSERGKEARRKGTRKYRKTNKGKEINRKQARKDMKKYHNQLCSYNGETLTLNTLSARFIKAKIEHPTLEAKKYLLNKQ